MSKKRKASDALNAITGKLGSMHIKQQTQTGISNVPLGVLKHHLAPHLSSRSLATLSSVSRQMKSEGLANMVTDKHIQNLFHYIYKPKLPNTLHSLNVTIRNGNRTTFKASIGNSWEALECNTPRMVLSPHRFKYIDDKKISMRMLDVFLGHYAGETNFFHSIRWMSIYNGTDEIIYSGRSNTIRHENTAMYKLFKQALLATTPGTEIEVVMSKKTHGRLDVMMTPVPDAITTVEQAKAKYNGEFRRIELQLAPQLLVDKLFLGAVSEIIAMCRQQRPTRTQTQTRTAAAAPRTDTGGHLLGHTNAVRQFIAAGSRPRGAQVTRIITNSRRN